jgi:glucuronoarabinoxylan endo-1,4-beta-xylanase
MTRTDIALTTHVPNLFNLFTERIDPIMALRSYLSSNSYRIQMLSLVCLAASIPIVPVCAAAQTGTVDFTTSNQQIEGFGFSDAFGEANSLKLLSPANQTTILDLLYNRQTGAGFSMLRLGIGTDSQIEPTSPGSPNATPTYVFDGSDGGQVWLAQQGQKYGLNDFFADSWSAPGFMKSNGSIDNGGYLCGTVDAPNCGTGDWRQAYANYLVQYAKFYQGAGIPISALGFLNEPDYNVTYNSMQATTSGALDFIDNAYGPTMRASGLSIRTFCCDGSKTPIQTPFTQAITADPLANSYIDIITSHEYGGHFTSPQPTSKPVWMSEWSSSNGTFEPRWDCGGCSGGPDGMYLAGDIIQAFVSGNVNAYSYWWGTSTGAAALILTTPSSKTAPYTVAGRFYAIAGISRFVRPGAYRVSTTVSNTNLATVGFRNTDGSKVFVVLNNASTPVAASFMLDADSSTSNPRTYLTDTAHNIEETDTAVVSNGELSLTLPARSLIEVTFPPNSLVGSAQLIISSTIRKLGDGSYEAAVKITNNGSGTVSDVQLTTAQLGSASGAPAPTSSLPQVLGSIAPGGYLIAPLNFGASAGASGTTVLQRYAGTYSSGSFGASLRTVLP